MDVPSSTLDNLESIRQGKLAVWSRRGLLVGIGAIMLAAGTRLLGDKNAEVGASGGGYDLELLYARIARPGLDVPWQVTVRHPGGFPGDTVTLGVTGDYLNIYEGQGFQPDPSDSTQDGENLYLTFNKPPGDTLVVSFDAYVQPNKQSGSSGTVSVVVDHRSVVSLDFTTTLLP